MTFATILQLVVPFLVRLVAPQHEIARLATRILCRVHACHQPLRRRLLVSAGAVDLARQE